jgi:hypothetical protein
MIGNLDGVIWLAFSLGLLLFLQRNLHKEVQILFLFLTRRIDITVILFSVLFIPGILLHEGSHFAMARLVGVPTGRFSILPRSVGKGKLQLGFVETASTDWFRDALIGMAPLFCGGLVVAYIGVIQLNLLSLAQELYLNGLEAFIYSFRDLVIQPDFWLWFYLALVISSTMLPSETDRRAWLPLGLMLAIVVGFGLILGAGPWMAAHLAEPFNQIIKAVSIVFGISAALHMILVPCVWLLRRILGRLLRLEVVI